MDEWMTCDFMFFSTVFQAYQDRSMIMTGYLQWNAVLVEKISPQAGLKPRTAR